MPAHFIFSKKIDLYKKSSNRTVVSLGDPVCLGRLVRWFARAALTGPNAPKFL